MGTELQVWALYVTLGNAIISGVVALFTIWLSHVYTSERETKKDRAAAIQARQAMRREKLEKLVALVYEYSTLRHREAMRIAEIGISAALGTQGPADPEQPSIDPLDEAAALQMLYFPELATAIQQVRVAGQVHLVWVAAEIDRMARDAQEWSANSRPTYGPRAAIAHGQLSVSQNILAEHARQLLQEMLP